MPRRRWRRRRRADNYDEFDEEAIWIDPRGPAPDGEPENGADDAEPEDEAPGPELQDEGEAAEPYTKPDVELVDELDHAPEPAEEEDRHEPVEGPRGTVFDQLSDEALAREDDLHEDAEGESASARTEGEADQEPDETEDDRPPAASAPPRDVIRPGRDSERLGPRRAALHERRRRRRRRALGTVAAVLVAGGVAGAAILFDIFAGDNGSAGGPPREPPGVERDETITMLLFGTKETSSRPNAIWMTLLSFDREEERGAIVYIPAHSAVEVPGRGLQAVGDSLSSGGVPLLLLSSETLLGIPIDSYVELSNKDARLVFNATGPLSVDVPDQVRVSAGPNKAKLIFDEGLQRLPSSFLVQLLYTVGLDGDDVDLGARHTAFWAALFAQFEDEPEELAGAVETAGGALNESDVEPGDVAGMFHALASLRTTDRTLTTLPVQPVSVGGSELFESDSEEIAAFMRDTLGVDPQAAQEARVQILNGNGEPGIGKVAAERLVGEGFRVVLTGNAPRLDYKRTLIVTYDTGPEGAALADRAKDLLGVGKVQVSAQAQGIVDLTIVVGKDFLRTR